MRHFTERGGQYINARARRGDSDIFEDWFIKMSDELKTRFCHIKILFN